MGASLLAVAKSIYYSGNDQNSCVRPITPTLNSDHQLREFRIGHELKFEFLLLIDQKL